jgi:hypothetical protein
MNAENSLDLFLSGRMGTISEGVTSLLEGREPPPPPSSIVTFLVYGVLFGLLAAQAFGIIRSAAAFRSGRPLAGRLGPRWHIALSLVLNLAWAGFVLVLVPKSLGLPLLVIAQGFPDLAYLLLISASVALVWGVVRTVWAFLVLRRPRRAEGTAQAALVS